MGTSFLLDFHGPFSFCRSISLGRWQPAAVLASSAQQSNQTTRCLRPSAQGKCRYKERTESKWRKALEAAIPVYQDLLKTDPKNAEYADMIGIAYLDLSNYDQAKEVLPRTLRGRTKNASAVNNLGMVYYHQKDFRRAIREYQRAVTIDPPKRAREPGLRLLQHEQISRATTEFKKALEIDPNIFEHNDRVRQHDAGPFGFPIMGCFFTMAKVYAQKERAMPRIAPNICESRPEGYKDIAKAMSRTLLTIRRLYRPSSNRCAPEQKGPATHPGA